MDAAGVEEIQAEAGGAVALGMGNFDCAWGPRPDPLARRAWPVGAGLLGEGRLGVEPVDGGRGCPDMATAAKDGMWPGGDGEKERRWRKYVDGRRWAVAVRGAQPQRGVRGWQIACASGRS